MTATAMKFYGTIGDVNPIEHDGGVVFEEDKESGPEVIYFSGWEDGEVERVTVFRFSVAEDKIEDLNWWVDWKGVASYTGVEETELKSLAISDDVLTRAWVYESVASYHGFRDLDAEPEELTLDEAEAKYGSMADQAANETKLAQAKKGAKKKV